MVQSEVKLISGFFCQMIEGFLPFNKKQDDEVPKAYASKERPPFTAHRKKYPHGLKEYVFCCL